MFYNKSYYSTPKYSDANIAGAIFTDLTLKGPILLYGEPGLAGQVLTSRGGNQAPYWTTPSGGGGLPTLGTANQLLRVNSGGTALEYFTPSYLTNNQTITLSGAITGSGTTAITTTLGTLGATTNGQVLTWNGSAWGAAAPTGGVTGSGTTNYHAKWSGASALTSAMTYDNGSTFFFPTTASRLRIGGTNEFTRIGIYVTPTFTDPSTTVYAMRLTSTVAVSTTEFKGFYNSLSVGSGVTITSNFGAYLTDTSGAGTVTNNYGIYIEAQTKGTNNYSLYSLGGVGYHEGNLGVGTPSPSQKLHVVGKAVISDQVLFSDGTAALPGGSFANDTNTGIFRPTADNLAFATGGGERARFDADGDFGIGTTTPSTKLHVQGSGQITGDFYAGNIFYMGNITTQHSQFFYDAGSTQVRFNALSGKNLNIGAGGNLNYLFIKTDGKIGFGNVAPTEVVDVTGNVKFSGALMPGGSAGTTRQVLTSAGAGNPPTWENIINSYTTAQRDALVSPAAGLIIYNTTVNKHQGYNGSTWNDFY